MHDAHVVMSHTVTQNGFSQPLPQIQPFFSTESTPNSLIFGGLKNLCLPTNLTLCLILRNTNFNFSNQDFLKKLIIYVALIIYQNLLFNMVENTFLNPI